MDFCWRLRQRLNPDGHALVTFSDAPPGPAEGGDVASVLEAGRGART